MVKRRLGEEDQIRLRLLLVQKATGALQFVPPPPIEASRPAFVITLITRIQIHRNNRLLERQYGRGLVLPQHRRSHQAATSMH